MRAGDESVPRVTDILTDESLSMAERVEKVMLKTTEIRQREVIDAYTKAIESHSQLPKGMLFGQGGSGNVKVAQDANDPSVVHVTVEIPMPEYIVLKYVIDETPVLAAAEEPKR